MSFLFSISSFSMLSICKLLCWGFYFSKKSFVCEVLTRFNFLTILKLSIYNNPMLLSLLWNSFPKICCDGMTLFLLSWGPIWVSPGISNMPLIYSKTERNCFGFNVFYSCVITEWFFGSKLSRTKGSKYSTSPQVHFALWWCYGK